MEEAVKMMNITQLTIEGLPVQLLAKQKRTMAFVCANTDSFLGRLAMSVLGTWFRFSDGVGIDEPCTAIETLSEDVWGCLVLQHPRLTG